MSLMGMRRAVKQYGTPIWIFLALVLTLGVGFTGLGSYIGGGGQPAQDAAEPPIATVGEIKVTRSSLDQTINQFAGNPSPQDRARFRLMLLEQYKQQAAVIEAAKRAGITVTEDDLEKARDDAWKQQRTAYITALGLKPNATDADISTALSKSRPGLDVDYIKDQYPENELRIGAYSQKLQDKFRKEAQAKATEETVRGSYSDIKVRHILVASGPQGLPEAQARSKAQKLLDEVKKNPGRMAELARANTDDPGSKANGGLYDWAPGSRYVPAFTEAALAVKPGQVYPDLVPTPYGFHIIMPEGVRPGKDLPKDFDKNKQKYIGEYVDRIASQRVQEAVAAAQPGVQVQIQDPTLRAAQLQQDAQALTDKKARDAKLNQALAELAKVKPADDPTGVATFQRAAIYESLGDTKQAIAAYNEALRARNTLETRLALAQLHLKDKNKTAAVAELQLAEKLVRGEVDSQRQLAGLYRQAGRADLAAAADKKHQEMLKRQAAISKAMPSGNNITMPPASGGNAGSEPQAGGGD